ncbi:hypothetical protein [uncultured Gammaproteobacteria bacterium]|jgi:hypothetical protein|nr:hypothetical protein [uncultured Gammaproteobacteria bacterium]VVH57039.1 hypothetical protein BSPCLSOX_2996 [uncultured Gammaproteobacteria bacterium]
MRYKLLVVFLLPSLVFAGVNNKPKINYEALDKIPSNGLARVMGEGMAKSLPVQLDVLTRTTRVSVDENIITTFKEINTEHDSIKSVWEKSWESVKETFTRRAFKMDSQMACNDKMLNYLIVDRGVIFKYDYINKENKPLFNYTVSREDCLKVK